MGDGMLYSYKFKARPTTEQSYVWGGEGVTSELNSNLFLTIRVEETGEEVEFGTLRRDSGAPTRQSFGRLLPGQSYTVRLDGITGVYAICKKRTYLLCSLHGMASIGTDDES